MTKGQPKLFKNWREYTKQRQIMASAMVFKKHGWHEWQAGHARLYGILLWFYETEKQADFKYCKTLKKHGYGRTHNYRIIKRLIEENLLEKKGEGYYSLPSPMLGVIDKVLLMIKKLDLEEEKEDEEKFQNTASSEMTTQKNVKKRNAL